MTIRFACPYCKKEFDAYSWYGKSVRCNECDVDYPDFGDGLMRLHRGDESWQQCLAERDGWVSVTKARGTYALNAHQLLLPDGEPHTVSFYKHPKMAIDKLLEIENLDGLTCLDLGAGIGWGDCYILKHYPQAKIVALDVSDDRYIGIGRSIDLMTYHGVRFVPIVGDMHHIPIASESVDVVWTIDALHHFRDLSAVCQEINRVLKPGGRYYGLFEPARAEGSNENDAMSGILEVKHGVIERRPTLAEYHEAGKMIGLREINDEIGLVSHGLFLKGIRR